MISEYRLKVYAEKIMNFHNFFHKLLNNDGYIQARILQIPALDALELYLPLVPHLNCIFNIIKADGLIQLMNMPFLIPVT